MRGKHIESGIVFVHRNRYVEEMSNRSLGLIYTFKLLQIISVHLLPTVISKWNGRCFHTIQKNTVSLGILGGGEMTDQPLVLHHHACFQVYPRNSLTDFFYLVRHIKINVKPLSKRDSVILARWNCCRYKLQTQDVQAQQFHPQLKISRCHS